MIRLVIADDHAVVRMGLRFVLKINPEIEVVAEAADGDEAMKAVREHNPDILLLDIRMPGRDGLSALDEILAAFPKLKVLMLSTSDAEEDIFRSIEAGARGYVVKDNRPEIIVDAVNKVAAGETYMTDQVRRIYEMRKTLPDLTPRELELLRLMARGLTNGHIVGSRDQRGHRQVAPSARLREDGRRDARRGGRGGDPPRPRLKLTVSMTAQGFRRGITLQDDLRSHGE